MRRSCSILVLPLAVLAATFSAGTAAAAPPAPLQAAREVLVLTRERLGLMDEVMAAKWFSRTPIQDPAQESVVIEGAVAKGTELGVPAPYTRELFEAEIAAAKEVELGWGSEWLFIGAPPGLAAPDLDTLRAELNAISEQIVAVLPRLGGLAELPDAKRSLARASERVFIDVPFFGFFGRRDIVRALLGLSLIRP